MEKEPKKEFNNGRRGRFNQKRKAMLNEPILITGCARSGTSMTAGIINICGAWGGRMSGPNANNKKGMFENATIRNKMVKPFFRQMGVDPLGQAPLPDIDEVKLVSQDFIINWRLRIQEILVEHGYELTGNSQWFYKGAKMCLHWPVWHRAYPDAKWIIVRRKSSDIVRSCLKTGFMRAYRNQAGWLKWIDEHKERFIEMREAGLNIQYVWPQFMIDRDLTEIRRVVENLGLTWKQKEVEAFIEPALWSGKGMSGKSTPRKG